MIRLGQSLRLLLALCVALVSVHTAVGRAQALGAAEWQLCIGASVVTVTLDADGTPVEHHHACPDCVLSGLAVTPDAALALAPIPAATLLERPMAAVLAATAPRPEPLARGPPAPVPA